MADTDPTEREMGLATSAHAVLLAWNSSMHELAEAVSNLGGSLADWLQANDLRMCDGCGHITDAGDSPDWVNGLCTDCDPSLDPPVDAAVQAGDLGTLRSTFWDEA